MPRKRRSRNKNFQAIPFTKSITVGTPAVDGFSSETVFTSALAEDFYAISGDFTVSIRGLTAGEGPLQIGVNHGDLTMTEVGECLDSNLSDPDDIIAREQSRRPVRSLGHLHGIGTDEVMNDGKPIRQKLKFMVGSGHNIDVWLRNKSGAQLTTGAVLVLTGVIYGRWVR